MNYWQVMDLPIRVFWLMNGNISRILAEKDIRSLEVGIASQSADGSSAVRKHLVIEMENKNPEDVLAISEERDEEGFNELKMMQF